MTLRQLASLVRRRGARNENGKGPFGGVPFLLKDLGASLAGAPEAMGCRALRTHVATESAWIVQRYLDGGLVVFGKTNTPEFGLPSYTEPLANAPARTPYDTARGAGGSSGGAAVAVAATKPVRTKARILMGQPCLLRKSW